MRQFARVTGWGKALPRQLVDNDELSKTLPTSDEWITTRTGIRARRIASDEETPSTLGLEASRQALDVAGLNPTDIDLIITANSSPERVFPSTAALIQSGLGMRTVGAFDLNAACSGFLYGLYTAQQFISGGVYQKVLVVGADVYSRLLNWQDRSTCVLFGDGAGAAVIQASSEPGGILSAVMGNDHCGTDYVYTPGISASPLDETAAGGNFLVMNGAQVFKTGVRVMTDSTRQALDMAGITADAIDLFIPHQANLRIMRSVSESLGVPEEKVFVNVDRYGNTAGASIPIALCEAAESGRLHEGDVVALCAAGAGISWAAMVMEWRP